MGGLEKNSYDVVHERLVLINMPLATQQAILRQMWSLLRPGGTIAIEEFDFVSFACDPDHHIVNGRDDRLHAERRSGVF